MWRVKTLPHFFSPDACLVHGQFARTRPDGIVGWGRKPSGERARMLAERTGVPFLCLEDGFLRSLELGGDTPPYSVIVDDLGIYYDATTPSRLEALIARGSSDEERARARHIVDLWRRGRLSKYNHTREVAPPVSGPYVLAVDQTFGDASIAYGLAQPESFSRMLEAALDEHPRLPVVLKVHPDVIVGRKKGHFSSLTPGQASRVRIIASNAHPPSLIEPAHALYCVTSQMGFEGLLWGKPVRVFGMPFYAGWGLTGDELSPPDRRCVGRPVPLEDLIHAALVAYPRYIDPETNARCEPERLMEWMALQRRMRERFPQQVHAFAFSRWKKPIVRAFFSGSDVHFVRKPAQVPGGSTLAVWGRKEPALPASPAPSLVRLEDGFLRSVGLGANLVRPLSWVMDRTGMYYDATRPSDLETLLQTATFDGAMLERARALRERIVAAGLTKYNVGVGSWRRPSAARKVVLVPGQVESDASIAYGAPGVRTNIDLLRAARRAAPDAYLVYKPHPDVVAGLRKQGQGESEAAQLCDEIVIDAPMHALLAEVDELHVLTSLAGFEALLRGKPVRCEGLPFYAGWGLTTDAHRCERRTRRLTLDELVAGALILYPTYVSRTTGAFTTPERALDELLAWREQGPSTMPLWRKLLRAVLSLRKR